MLLSNLQIQYNFFRNTNDACIHMDPQNYPITEATKQVKKKV